MRATAMLRDEWQQYLESHPADDAGSAGVAWLPELAPIRFSGSNARDFLQGYLTCDTDRLAPGRLHPTALCNLKGRVVMNGWCAADGDADVLLVLHDSLVDTLQRFLEPYLRFSRNTTLEDLRAELVLIATQDLPDLAEGLELDSRRRLIPCTGLGSAVGLWENHLVVPHSRWLAALTHDGIPLIPASVSETFLPQMLDLDAMGAIDFEKGCYLGQEVVARAQHRGHVKRRLARLTWHGARAPDPGAEITDQDGRPQGVVVQSAADDADGGPALAVLRQDAPDGLLEGDTRLTRTG